MKKCLKCGREYNEPGLNFCLDDGEPLIAASVTDPFDPRSNEPPPTLYLDPPRVTNPTNWQQPYQSQSPAQYQQPQMQFAGAPAGPNQTLAVVSLCLGIASVTIGWCCSLGILLSPAALITGFIALSQINKDPSKYKGRGLAMGGIITAADYIVGLIAFMLLYGAAALLGGLK